MDEVHTLDFHITVKNTVSYYYEMLPDILKDQVTSSSGSKQQKSAVSKNEDLI
jgi:hypothetical protein